MRALLLAPHNDDETLFAAYTVLKHACDVIVVLRGVKDGGTDQANLRAGESAYACSYLAAGSFRQWHYSDRAPDWPAIKSAIHDTVAAGYDLVFAPAVELGGHEHHNAIGNLADEVCRELEVELTAYMTYVRGRGRSSGSHRVVPGPGYRSRKLAAMSCYLSQIDNPDMLPWFTEWEKEWYE